MRENKKLHDLDNIGFVGEEAEAFQPTVGGEEDVQIKSSNYLASKFFSSFFYCP